MSSKSSSSASSSGRIIKAVAAVALLTGASGAIWNFFLKGDSDTVEVALVKGAASKSTTPILSGEAVGELATKLKFDASTSEPINLGSGVSIASGTVNKKSDGSMDAQLVIAFGTNGLLVNMNASVTDADNWELTAATQGAPMWSPAKVPAFTLDPNTLAGSISKSDGKLSYALTGASHIWNIGDGVTYTSVLSFSSECPMSEASKCPTESGAPYLGMNGTLGMSGITNQLSLTGGLAMSGNWARFEGTTDDITLGQAGSGSFTVAAPTFTMWRGPRTDSFSDSMKLPELGSLSNGTNIEFCGGFNIEIPKVGNKGTDGCVRWSPKGFVIGQVAEGADISGSMSSTSTPATASVKGVSWTNIANSVLTSLPSRDSVFNGVTAPLQNKTFTLAGKAVLPGTVAAALNSSVGELPVDVRGKFSADSIDLNGTVNVDISAGSEPFRIDIKSMNLGITASKDAFEFSLGSSGKATLGYKPNTRTVNTTTQLVASTDSGASMVLSVNARGKSAPVDAELSGITADSRLTDPRNATFVWPNQFGISGMNLWNLTVQIGFTKGSPSLAYSSTTYLDPVQGKTSKMIGCRNGACTDSDWLMGNLITNFSMTNPCFAYGFDSTSGNSGVSIDKGVLRTSTFQFGVAPAGCSVIQGDQTTTLPVGFAGFAFTTTFGDTPSTLSFASYVTAKGFEAKFHLDDFKIAKTRYTDVDFLMTVNGAGSQFSFGANMDSGMGQADVQIDFAVNGSGYDQNIELTLTDWKWGRKDNVELTRFHYKKSVFIKPGECGSYNTDADGNLKVGSRSMVLERATISIDCTGVKKLDLMVTYGHKVKWNGSIANSEFTVSYPHKDRAGKKDGFVYAGANFAYDRTLRRRFKMSPGIYRTFNRSVKVKFSMQTWVDPNGGGDGAFQFSGEFDADRIGGSISCLMDMGNDDFTCGGKVKYDPDFAGRYEMDWGSEL